MIIYEDWNNFRFCAVYKRKKAKEIILKTNFQNVVSYTFTTIIVKMLKLVYGNKWLAIGYIYNTIDRVKDAINGAFGGIKKKYENIFHIIDAR